MAFDKHWAWSPPELGVGESPSESESTHRVAFMQIGNLRSVFDFEEALTLPRLSFSYVCPEVVKVAAQLTASSPCRRTLMTLAIIMMSPPFECGQIVRVAVCEIQKGIAFFLPIWVPFYGHNTHTLTQHDIQDSTRRRDAPQQATKFSEAHRNDTMPIARWLIGVSWVVGQQKSPMKWRNDGMTHGLAGKQQRAI